MHSPQAYPGHSTCHVSSYCGVPVCEERGEGGARHALLLKVVEGPRGKESPACTTAAQTCSPPPAPSRAGCVSSLGRRQWSDRDAPGWSVGKQSSLM